TEEQYYITGLPVAEDTFGVEMFHQMAQSAPTAMLVIFLLLWWFFKRLIFVISPMIVALVCALSTMGLLIISGNTIHIMSSMIPIFIMPIAVLDAIHILSDFFDRYAKIGNKRDTLLHVMGELFSPMLYTTLTTIAGFASLALTPIPPVQVFGIFIAIGVLLAWFWTVMFIPAFIMFIPEEKLASFCIQGHDEDDKTLMARLLDKLGVFTFNHARLILMMTFVVIGVAVYGIKQININDNPIKWFQAEHPIRVADKVLNEHFGGTYMAYLVLEPNENQQAGDFKTPMLERFAVKQQQMQADGVPNVDKVIALVQTTIQQQQGNQAELMTSLIALTEKQLETAVNEELEAWDEAQLFLDSERQREQLFKTPEALNYLAVLQAHINNLPMVGKSNSLADVVKTVHRELLLGEEKEFRIPDSANAVAQTLITYQGSHRPHDLWHFVTPDYRKTSLWIQLKSGDNQDMIKVESAVAKYIENNPPPYGLQHQWFGLTHINVAWQEKMVTGMLEAFLGSFIVVLVMMIVLFRSFFWGVLSMIPLTVTVGLIYGFMGLIGKDYDMPAAVLSALSIGLAVDYSIHFISRARSYTAKTGSWEQAIKPLFGEPARAIARNAIVVGVGFLPLLAAPLMPYKTVGFFIAAILILAGVSSLFILPALITLMEKWAFRNLEKQV
ncbi:MAG: MMPL family transporter, partial [Methylococcaceae bacterium]|nr:MMPL family transporter [Methylococcaceae bacterium]